MTFPYIIHDLIWDYCIKMPHCCSVGSHFHIKSDKDIKSTSPAIFSLEWKKQINDPESLLLTCKLSPCQKEEEWLVSQQTLNHSLINLKTRAVVDTRWMAANGRCTLSCGDLQGELFRKFCVKVWLFRPHCRIWRQTSSKEIIHIITQNINVLYSHQTFWTFPTNLSLTNTEYESGQCLAVQDAFVVTEGHNGLPC